MRVLIITQNDPFFLAKNLDYLITLMPTDVELVGCIVFDVSPFGKSESFFSKIKRTYKIFGLGFLVNYGFKFVLNKFDSNSSVEKVLSKHRVKKLHLEKGINNKKSLELIASYEPDLLVSIAGNQIFRKSLLDIPTKGTINLHTALLPKYRGLMPTFWAMKNNEKETGVSVFFVDEGIDSGPIIIQRRVPIHSQSQQDLIIETKKIGMDCIIEAIKRIKDNSVELIPNPQSKMTYYSFPSRQDVKEFKRAGKRFY